MLAFVNNGLRIKGNRRATSSRTYTTRTGVSQRNSIAKRDRIKTNSFQIRKQQPGVESVVSAGVSPNRMAR